MFKELLMGAFALAAAAPATAAWHKASSAHFVIYSDEDSGELKTFAAKLERFDGAVRLVRGMKDPPVGDGNRLTVFVVRSVNDLHKLRRGVDKGTAGFYLPRGSGSVAFVPRSAGTKLNIDPEVVFLHEYAHHLMFSDLAAPYPTWLVEGFAEFYSTANIGADGTVGLAKPRCIARRRCACCGGPSPSNPCWPGNFAHHMNMRLFTVAAGCSPII